MSFCSLFKALSTDASFIKIGVCYQKLSTLEYNFHYRLSSHFVFENYHVIFARTRTQVFTRLGRKTEKGTTKWLGKSFTRLITQSQDHVYKAGKLTIYSRTFPAVLVVLSSYNNFVTALITSCLERHCAVVSKSWLFLRSR